MKLRPIKTTQGSSNKTSRLPDRVESPPHFSPPPETGDSVVFGQSFVYLACHHEGNQIGKTEFPPPARLMSCLSTQAKSSRIRKRRSIGFDRLIHLLKARRHLMRLRPTRVIRRWKMCWFESNKASSADACVSALSLFLAALLTAKAQNAQAVVGSQRATAWFT